MFTEAFNEVLLLLGAGTGDIARVAEWGCSNVSRFSSGARVPAAGGPAAQRLVKAICDYAEQTGQWERLSDWCRCPKETDGNVLPEFVSRQLFSEEPTRRRKKSAEHTPYSSFGNRLDRLMKVLELSNVRLGRMINMDASYISRFRSGQRSPQSNPKTMQALCMALCEQCRSHHAYEAVSQLTGISPQWLSEEEEGALQMQRWLFNEVTMGDTPTVERLLANVDSFSINRPDEPPPLTEEEFRRLVDDRRVAYQGCRGRQEASLRFLAQVLQRGGGCMVLYSDQSIEGLKEPNDYGRKWYYLLEQCVRRGIRVKIIHHLNRSIEELTESVQRWFTLYMSGMIESYYRKKQNEGCFSHVLFFAEGVGCVAATNIIGAPEEECRYRFFTAPEDVAYFRTSYQRLLATSRPLISIYNSIRCGSLPPLEGKKITMFGACPLSGTIPQEVLMSVLERYHADETVREVALSERRLRRERLLDKLKEGTVEEYVPVASPGEEGKIQVDVPEQRFFYTPEEYRRHMEQIAQFQKEHPNYMFYSLPIAYFPHTLIRFDETVVRISRLKEPFCTYSVTHPALTESFAAYAHKLKKSCLNPDGLL